MNIYLANRAAILKHRLDNEIIKTPMTYGPAETGNEMGIVLEYLTMKGDLTQEEIIKNQATQQVFITQTVLRWLGLAPNEDSAYFLFSFDYWNSKPNSDFHSLSARVDYIAKHGVVPALYKSAEGQYRPLYLQEYYSGLYKNVLVSDLKGANLDQDNFVVRFTAEEFKTCLKRAKNIDEEAAKSRLLILELETAIVNARLSYLKVNANHSIKNTGK